MTAPLPQHVRQETLTNPRRPSSRLEAPKRLSVRSFGLTHPGRVQTANQDQFLTAMLAPMLRVRQSSLPQEKWWPGDERGHLFAVADGVTGQQGGEEASALAVNVVEHFLLNRLPRHFGLGSAAGKAVALDLREAFRRADAAVHQQAARHPGLAGMSTTLTVAYSVGADLVLGHAGDSRCYVFRAGKLCRLTTDHTVATWLARHRLLRRGEGGRLPARRVLTHVVGGADPGVRPQLRKARLRAGDVLLLCTDGLTDPVPEAEIARVLAREPDPRRAAERLVARANERGGKDNVTVVLARFISNFSL